MVSEKNCYSGRGQCQQKRGCVRGRTHQFNELGAAAAVVEPAAAVDHVVLLEHPEAAADGRRVSEAENLPAVFRWVVLQEVLEPRDLLLVHSYLRRK